VNGAPYSIESEHFTFQMACYCNLRRGVVRRVSIESSQFAGANLHEAALRPLSQRHLRLPLAHRFSDFLHRFDVIIPVVIFSLWLQYGT
jgi:hypothetical protein